MGKKVLFVNTLSFSEAVPQVILRFKQTVEYPRQNCSASRPPGHCTDRPPPGTNLSGGWGDSCHIPALNELPSVRRQVQRSAGSQSMQQFEGIMRCWAGLCCLEEIVFPWRLGIAGAPVRITWKRRNKTCHDPSGRDLGSLMLRGQQCWSPMSDRCADLCERIGQRVCTSRRLADSWLQRNLQGQ